MNQYGLLVTSPVGADKNIGDYIQTLAALQYLPKDISFDFIEKEQISKYDNTCTVKCIMNAWYMWHPENWPPKENAITPLLTSIHISPLTSDEMLKNGGKEYFIKYGPVGCRDTGTLEILSRNGIPSYFSACLTLTLGEKYGYTGKRKGVIFVDPYIPPIRYVNGKAQIIYPKNILKAFGYFLLNPINIYKLTKKNFFKGRMFIQTYYNASMFYHAYSNMFDDTTLLDAEYISHMYPVSENTTQWRLIEEAETLIQKYARAKYVVTSRIHCALPCVGMETPVIFVLDKMMEAKENIFNAPGRFGGLLEFFRLALYKNNKVIPTDSIFKIGAKLSPNFSFVNKTNWKLYRDRLIKQVKDFI